MSLIDRFGAYAAAFENAYKTDDWSLIEPYFTEDAVYEIPGGPPLGVRYEGRAEVLKGLHKAVDDFDRRFGSRGLELLEGPVLRGDGVWIRWRGIYTLEDAPDFLMEGEETATFDDDRIKHLEDRMAEGTAERSLAYMRAHGAKLKGA